jgi:c-di-GMP-binding flagellar brake protein YcgR
VSDTDLFSPFVGHWVALRPAAGREAAPGAHAAGPGAGSPLVAMVTSTTGRAQLRLETDDLRVLHLKDRAVYAEPTTSATRLRVQGMLEVLADPAPPAVCVLTPFDHPGALERRQWVRVPTVLPVRVDESDGGDGDGDPIRTTTVDVSGGGVMLRDGISAKVGAWVTLALELPSGPVEVRAEVLGPRREDATRLRFLRLPESVHSRIVRHVFDIQIEARRGRRGASA